MTIIKLLIRYFILLVIFLIPLCADAKDNDIILDAQTIISLESCVKSKNTHELNCSSYHQTTSYTCGPAAVMTLMHYYGKLSSQDMNRATEMRIAAEMGAAPDCGTRPSDVEYWLSKHGFHVENGIGVTTDMLINNINKHVLTIISYNGHWLVAKGYTKGATPDQDKIIFADSCCNTSIISRNEIDEMTSQGRSPYSHSLRQLGTYIVATPE